jgi:PAP2 superfamily
MRCICRFVPALALTSTLAFASTGNAEAMKVGPRLAPRSTLTGRAPNQVIVWNQILLGILGTPGAQPATIHPTRSLAMMHLAVANAVGAITRRYQPYRFDVPASPHASQAAAAASAAHEVLVSLYPSLTSALDADLASSLNTVRSDPGKTAGIEIGVRAGQAILRLRQNDGSAATPPPFVPGTAPGDYRLTPPGFGAPVFTQWPDVTPFVLESANQFRPGPPPGVGSEAYANALGQVRSIGQDTSLTRSPEQTEIGQFWSAPIQNYWNAIAVTASLAHHDSIADDARLFALLNTSLADDAIAFYDAKYTYRFWRPVSAINNDGIPADTIWVPLVKTPADPSYPGAHGVISSDAARILSDEFGDRFDFEVTSPVLPGVLRHFSSFGAAAREAGRSRIYAGDHFSFDIEAGANLGRRIAGFVLTRALTPTRQRIAALR